MLRMLGASFLDVLSWWPVHADSLLIRATLVTRQWWPAGCLAATACALSAGAGAFVAATAVLQLQRGLAYAELIDLRSDLADVTSFAVPLVVRWGPAGLGMAAALPRFPAQLALVAVVLCGVERSAVARAVFIGRAVKCGVIAWSALRSPEWLVRLGLGSELTRARCGGKATLLPLSVLGDRDDGRRQPLEAR